MPNPAPAVISLNQWRSLSIRSVPVVVATKKPALANQILLFLYSKKCKVAQVKAAAVCPDGNALQAELSGLKSPILFFNGKAMAVSSNFDTNKLESIRALLCSDLNPI